MTFLAAATAIAAVYVSSVSTLTLLALIAALGGLSIPLYSLCIAHANDYLEPEQATLIAVDLLEALGVNVTRSHESALCAEFRNLKLAHGDFAALLRRYAALKTKPDWKALAADLKTEASYREEAARPIGFLADLQD